MADLRGVNGRAELFRWDVINELLGTTRAKRFLEIGVQRGVCGSKVRAAIKVGVDPEPLPTARRHYTSIHRETSDNFFSALPEAVRFDVVLVDGLHHGDQVLRDVDNALRHLSPDGVIVLHDCNPQNELAQRVPREVGVWNGDCWRAMVALRQRADVDAFTIAADHGIGVVRRKANPAPLPTLGALDYQALERDRAALLDLTPPDRWQERFGAPLALGRVVLVTAITGGRDKPIALPRLDVDDAVMFTDGPGADGWRVVQLPSAPDPRRAARRIKALALELVEGDVVIWIDGRIAPTGAPLRPLLRAALAGSDFAGYPHPWRSCVYTEASECVKLGLAPPDLLRAQGDAYRAEGFPSAAGLLNTMVFARRRSPIALDVGRAWWAELERYSLRDQVSLPVVLWRAGQRWAPLGKDVYAPGSSVHFRRGRHADAAA